MKVKIDKETKDKLFFTSDPHFFHKNIIKYCDRPFSDVDEMNEALIHAWNKVVPEDGVVFVLGDVTMGSTTSAIKWVMHQLKGTKYLAIGNHDRKNVTQGHIGAMWEDVGDIIELSVEDDEISGGYQKLVLCHYPMLTWNGSHKGSWQLFGHVHGMLDGSDKLSPNQLDVGVDSHNYTPISYEEVKVLITKQNLKHE